MNLFFDMRCILAWLQIVKKALKVYNIMSQKKSLSWAVSSANNIEKI